MAQHDYVIADGNGAIVLADLNDAFSAIATTNKGNSAPSSPYAGQFWIDDNTPSSTVWTLNLYDGSDWIAVGYFDITNNRFLPNITALDALTAPATDDALPIYDTDAATSKKITLANMLKVINSLTEDTTPDLAEDFLLSYDSSASAVKKVKPSSIAPPSSSLLSLFSSSTGPGSGATTFLWPFGHGGESGATGRRGIVMPFACTVRNLQAAVTDAPGGVQTFTYTLRKNGSDQSLEAVITGAARTASDTSDSVSFDAGDELTLKLVTSASATAGSGHSVALEILAV